MDYKKVNQEHWNQRTGAHVKSEFYDVKGFLAGKSSINEIEAPYLGDVSGKRVLHLQCHFGQDTLSLARMGAKATGVDLSNKAIDQARQLNTQMGLDAEFVCCDVLEIDQHLEGEFDIIFTSYGTIGWLPEIKTWGKNIARFLKPGGKFIIAEFHPVVWMFDDDIKQISYSYFNVKAYFEEGESTYTENAEEVTNKPSYFWNHGLSEVFNALKEPGLRITHFEEYDYSPYNVFPDPIKTDKGYQVKRLAGKMPMVYLLVAEK